MPLSTLGAKWAFGASVAALLATAPSDAQDGVRTVLGSPTNEARLVNTYPEYWVDGRPFFGHCAEFSYHRIPRDRWADELGRLKSMGVNMVALRPFWNWHQPREDTLDFDGSTNPRRDLKYLLRLLELSGMKLTFRPGPYFADAWRNGGYPDWLLKRPEYLMSRQSILEGRYPRLSAMQAIASEKAATEWLRNSTHLRYTQKWYRDVLAVVKPLVADRGGPLLNLQLDADPAPGRENFSGPKFWKYMDLLRRNTKDALGDARLPDYLGAEAMRVNAEANDATSEPLWNTGRDHQSFSQGGYSTLLEAAKNKFMAEVVKTQPLFVPVHSEFQAGRDLGEKDTFAAATDPTNTLMASRVMFQNGMKGLCYHPLADTLYPAGYEVQWANHHYSQEGAVNFLGQETPRAWYVRRNGRLLAGMGPLLGQTHLLADAAVVYPMAAFPQAKLTADETNRVADLPGAILWAGAYDHFNFELVDSDHTPLENFQRYKVLILPSVLESPDDAKRLPNLATYSDKSQRMLKRYLESGGTVVVLPSLPGGKLFRDLFAPLGEAHFVAGDTGVVFSDGTRARALGGRTVLKLPAKTTAEVQVFARDEDRNPLGARYRVGKGQVLFLGANFSRWMVPPGKTVSLKEGGVREAGGTGQDDYSEEVQRTARALLAGLMREAGVTLKAFAETAPLRPRELGLYVSELVSDSASLPFERREPSSQSFGFLGVINFDVKAPRTATLVVTDPRFPDSSSAAPERSLRLPKVTVPPREALLLPLRLPLGAGPRLFEDVAPGLGLTDEVLYATVELTHVRYDGSRLSLEFNAPMDGEVALRLEKKPLAVLVDGATATLRHDLEHKAYVLDVPHGQAPHFIRRVELTYPSREPKLAVTLDGGWVAGERATVSVQLFNPRSSLLMGDLDFTVSGARAETRAAPVQVAAGKSVERTFELALPKDLPDRATLRWVALFREQGADIAWAQRGEVIARRPFTLSFLPVSTFPLREEQAIPIVHPVLASVELPGKASFQVKLENGRSEEQTFTLSFGGTGLTLPALREVSVPASSERVVDFTVEPATGGVFRFEATATPSRGGPTATEGAILVALFPGEASAYLLDYDRDGFDDVILENRMLRCMVSPRAGGRSFALVDKKTNTNAFNSVGAMKDTFTTRFEPRDLKDVSFYTRMNWLGLYNRAYDFKVVSAFGATAEVRLSHFAPDIYPSGVRLERTLTLRGDLPAVLSTTEVAPNGVKESQAYVAESAVPFRVFDEPNYNQWFAAETPEGYTLHDFAPDQEVALPLRRGLFGTRNKKSGQTFALMLLTPGATSRLAASNHSASVRVTYPPFEKGSAPRHYRVGYYVSGEPLTKAWETFAELEKPRVR